MAAETGFLIEDEIYEVPSLDSFTLDEAQILYDYSGIIVEDFVAGENESAEEADERSRKFDNPGLTRALMHISYQRRHTELKPAKVKALIGSANIVEQLKSLGQLSDVEEANPDPPASTTELEPSSLSGSVVSTDHSGSDSTNDSEERASGLVRIGTGRSVTSSLESTRTTSGV